MKKLLIILFVLFAASSAWGDSTVVSDFTAYDDPTSVWDQEDSTLSVDGKSARYTLDEREDLVRFAVVDGGLRIPEGDTIDSVRVGLVYFDADNDVYPKIALTSFYDGNWVDTTAYQTVDSKLSSLDTVWELFSGYVISYNCANNYLGVSFNPNNSDEANYTYVDGAIVVVFHHTPETCTLAIDSVTVTQLSHAKAKFQVDGHCGWDTVIIEVDTSATAYANDSTTVTADTTFTDTIGGLFVDGWNYRVIVADGAVRDTVTGTFSQDWLVSQIDTVYFTETHLNYSSNKDSIYVEIYTDCSVQGDTIVHKLSLSGYPDSSSGNYLKLVKDSTCVASVSYDTISAIQPETVYCSSWNTKYAGGERSWSNRHQSYFVTAIAPDAVSELTIDTTYRSTSIPDTVTTSITAGGKSLGSWDADSLIRVYTYGSNTSPDSMATNHRWACRTADAESSYVFKDTMRVMHPDTVRVYVWQISNAREGGVWSTRTLAKVYWPAPAADTSKIQDARIVTFYDKRAKTLSHIADEDSLGHNNPDTTNPVDWHPYFNFINNRGVATESVKVTVFKPTGDILCQWAESLVCAQGARSRNLIYPSDTVYGGHSIVIQSGQQHSYKIQTKAADSTWTSATTPQYFWGVIPDNIDSDSAFSGFRNYVPVSIDSSHSVSATDTTHSLVGVGHTVTVPFPTGWGRVLDSGTVVNTATAAMTSYGKYTLTCFQRQEDSTGANWISIIERNDSTGITTGPVNVLPCYPSDMPHYMNNMAIADSAGHKYLIVVRGSHPSKAYEPGKNGMITNRTKHYFTDSTGFCIDDTNWTGVCKKLGTIVSTTKFKVAGMNWTTDQIKGYRIEFLTNMPPHAETTFTDDGDTILTYGLSFTMDSVKSCDSNTIETYGVYSFNTNIRLAISKFEPVLDGAYPTLFSAGGDVFCIFRYRNWATDPIWSTLAYSRYHNGVWGNRRYIVQYTDPGIYRQNSTYYSAYNKPGETRLDILVTFRDGYGYENQDRGTAHLWSYLTADTQFTTWYQYDGYDSTLVGYTGLSLTTQADTAKDVDSMINYRDLTKVIECGNPNIVWENYSTGQDLHEPFILATQDNGSVSSFGRTYFSGTLYVDSSTNSMGNPLYNMFFFYDKSLAEWKRICMSGQTRMSAKTKGNHSAYNITVTHPNDTLMSLVVSNKWTDPETTETFDSITTIGQMWQAVNHGLTGKNGGNASNLIKIDWITDSLLPTVAKCSLKYAVGDSLYSAISFRDTLRELPNGLRQNRLVSEPEYNRVFMYVGYNPEDTNGWFGAEVWRRNLYGVGSDNFPTISRTLLTNNSAEGYAGLTVLPNVAYSTNPNRSRYTANYKQALINRARDLLLYNDRYTAGGMHKVKVDYALIDSTNTNISHTQRNRVTENQFGLLNTSISFRTGVSIPVNYPSPTNGVFVIMSGNDTATGILSSPNAVFANIGSEATYGKSFIGFENYPSYPCTLTNKSYWTIHPTSCSTMVTNQTRQDGGYVLPYQGNAAMIMYDSGYAMQNLPSAAVNNRSVSVYASIVTTGEPYIALKNQVIVGSDTVDTAAVYLALNKYRHSSFASQNKISATNGGYAWTGTSNLATNNGAYAVFNSINTVDSLTCKGFSFSVPTDHERIVGIQLTFDGHSDSLTARDVSKLKFYLTKDNAKYGDADSVQLKYQADSTYTKQNFLSGLWGTSPIAESVNASSFGVVFFANGSSGHRAIVYLDSVSIKIGYTINEDTAWAEIAYNQVQSGFAFTPMYHKLEIKSYASACSMFVNGIFRKTYNFTGYNRICLGNWHTGASDKIVFDALMQRGILANDVEPKIYFSPLQLLGSETPPLGVYNWIHSIEKPSPVRSIDGVGKVQRK